MKTISITSIILCLAAAIISCAGPCLGMDLFSGDDSGDEYTWYGTEAPSVAGRLVDEGLRPGQEENNGLWIVDSAEKERRTSLEVPMGAWARMMLAPSVSGELKLYCRYPTGTVDLLLMDDVEEGHIYSAWYLSEWGGDYEVWYTLDGSKSNTVRFQVREGWVVEDAMAKSGRGRSGVPGSVMYSYAPPAASPGTSIGLAAGGAKDINNFRENIDRGYMPLPTDVTYEGLFYDYYFETGQEENECEKLFCPSYSCAVSKDPFSGEAQRYLSVGLNSGITDFQRKKLNLVVVLDYSGSMGSPFDEYYYDRFGNKVVIEVGEEEEEGDSGKTKMEIADRAVVDLMGHLEEDDRFGMVVFSNEAFLVEPLTKVGDKDLDKLEESILEIEEYGGTNMEAGMKKGTAIFGRYAEIDPTKRENRIIFLTDAMPNRGGTGENDLFSILETNADEGIYTTFIGVGVDFNTELVEDITKIRGANYYSVHSAGEFKERMDEEFDFMVTPLVFDLRLELDAPGYKIEKVYGSPKADEATGEIMKVNTLFPSRAEEGEVKGGIILIKLKQISPEGDLKLAVSYEDRNGTKDGEVAVVNFPDAEPNFYQNDGIRKAVLLSRYADLLKDWIVDERRALDTGETIIPSVTLEDGIVVPEPVELGEWERQSVPLQVSEPYKKLFGVFGSYFETEGEALEDIDLQQEEVVLETLSTYQGGGV